jgi:mRNA interferase RelE/StbE
MFATKWSLKFTEKATKDFKKLDEETCRKIRSFIDNRLLPAENPRLLGKPLSGNLKQFWRYRIGDYRLICEIVDHTLTIMTLKIDHRRTVYKNIHFLKSLA